MAWATKCNQCDLEAKGGSPPWGTPPQCPRCACEDVWMEEDSPDVVVLQDRAVRALPGDAKETADRDDLLASLDAIFGQKST